MTILPASPFLDPGKPMSLEVPTPFRLDERAFWHAVDPTWFGFGDHPVWSTRDDPPLFISDPSEDFIACCHRDLLPLLEDLARRA